MSDSAKTTDPDIEQLRFEFGLLKTRLKVLESYLGMIDVCAANANEFERQTRHYIDRIEKSMFKIYELHPTNPDFIVWCGLMDSVVESINQKIFRARCGIV